MKKTMLIVFVSLLSACSGVMTGDFSSLHDDNKHKIFKVHSSKGTGTGFVVRAPSGSNYIVTNAHVCGKDATMGVQVGKRIVQRDVLDRNWSYDLCLIENLPTNPKGLLMGKVRAGDPIAILGHPRGTPLVVASGYAGTTTKMDVPAGDEKARENKRKKAWAKKWKLKYKHGTRAQRDKLKTLRYKASSSYCSKKGMKLNKYRDWTGRTKTYCTRSIRETYTSIIVIGGNSGSPVFNYDGEVVGVVNMTQNPHHFGIMIPSRSLKRFLKVY